MKKYENQLLDMQSRQNEADAHLQDKANMEERMANLEERLEAEKTLRLEQVNQKELDRIKETE